MARGSLHSPSVPARRRRRWTRRPWGGGCHSWAVPGPCARGCGKSVTSAGPRCVSGRLPRLRCGTVVVLLHPARVPRRSPTGDWVLPPPLPNLVSSLAACVVHRVGTAPLQEEGNSGSPFCTGIGRVGGYPSVPAHCATLVSPGPGTVVTAVDASLLGCAVVPTGIGVVVALAKHRWTLPRAPSPAVPVLVPLAGCPRPLFARGGVRYLPSRRSRSTSWATAALDPWLCSLGEGTQCQFCRGVSRTVPQFLSPQLG